MAIQSQQRILHHPDSPPDNAQSSLRQHIQSSEPLFNLHGSQANVYSQSNGLHLPDTYNPEFEGHKSTKMSNIYTRTTFASLPNATRPRHHQQSFRDIQSNWSPADVFSTQLTSPTLQHMSPYDSRASFDLNGLNGVPKSTGLIDPFNKPQSSAGYGNQSASYPQLSSQTPFGPHIPTNGGVPLSQVGLINQTQNQQEDISTIFVVGFPDDMQEREFQNMFTFSSGFEAATLKIPNKEYTAYGGPGSSGPSGRNYGYSGSNDPYNLVTVNQGGVVVDGRDGTMASWPAVDDSGAPGPHYGTSTVPPRKQIIGFAKFRSKEEALVAKEMLQGKRVDIEKGAVLKAEMAKKNLHTKRGVPGSASMPPANTGVGQSLGVIPQPMLNGHSDPYTLDSRDRDIGSLGTIGMNRMQWRDDPTLLAREREDDERWRERERDINVLGAMGLSSRGPRERVEEEDRDRRRREMRLRAGNTAFDPFHPSPISRQTSGAPNSGVVLSPPGSTSLLSPIENSNVVNGFHNHLGQATGSSILQPEDRVIVGPWDGSNKTIRPPSRRTPSPPSETQRPYSPSNTQIKSQSDSRSSSVAGGSQRGSTGHSSGSEEELSQAMGELAVSTSQGNTSPQLPSPSSGASSGGSTRNGVDQNPPINTLYVGNLPTSPPPPGMPPDVLEVSLRTLFQTRPGFSRLSFKQKNSGPMCFVEFEDVQYATKTLNDLYGHTLHGLVKGGGIRLSYSKNPLGVRTPTSATSSGATLQQQQQNGHFGLQEERPRRGVMPPPSSSQYPPPPRFTSSSATAFESSLSAPLTGLSDFIPRNGNMFAHPHSLTPFTPFGISNSSHSTIPDQHESDQQRNDQHYHYIPRALSPTTPNIEAARAG